MTLEELITTLIRLRQVHGNVDVCAYDDERGVDRKIDGIEFNESEIGGNAIIITIGDA